MDKIIWHKGKLVNASSITKRRVGTKNERKLVFSRDGHKCVKCGSKSNLTIDHVIPKSKGGRDSVTNYQTMCFKCNQEKAASIITEYIRT